MHLFHNASVSDLIKLAMLISAEHKIYHALKCHDINRQINPPPKWYNTNKFWIVTLTGRKNGVKKFS